MVHWNVLIPPATAVIPEVSRVGVVIVAPPDINVHEPVPIAGALPASTVEVAQIV